jgi:hypothetical protein
MARRRAADCSFGSGWRFEWTSITKAELTAENRPAYENKVSRLTGVDDRRWTTHEYQGGIEVLVVLLDVVRVVLGRLPLVHRVKVDAGIVGLDGLEERSESIVEAASAGRSATQVT